MAVTSKLFGQFFVHALGKKIDWLNDTIKATVHTVGYVPDQDVHDFANDLTSEHAASGGYTTGGVTLANKTLTYTGATNITTFDADDAVWSSATMTGRVVVLSDTTPGTAATNPLIGYHLSDVDIVSTGGEWRAQWNASGIGQLTAA